MKAKKPRGKKMLGQAEKVAKIKGKEKAMNPFELHFNKQKHTVLGQRLPGEIGKPGISKAKALKKRKLTLQRELKSRTKSNEFVDRRIGERTGGMSAEDRLAARFAAERKKQNRQALFNLEETTELTHMGQTLSEIEKYEDPRSDDEGDDTLGADFVKAAHFGGGLLERGGQAGAAPQSRKEWIDQMIAESKLRKYEARKALEETLEMTDHLDDNYKEVMQLLCDAKLMLPARSSKPSVAAGEDGAPPDEEYDALLRQLTFAPRVAQVADRTKSDAEVEREVAQRLRLLEEERLLRMRADPEDAAPPATHRSADDLDDGFLLDAEPAQRLQLVGDQLTVTSTATPEAPVSARKARKAAARAQAQRDDEDEEETETAPSSQQKLLASYKQLSSRLRQLPPLQQLHHVTSLSEKLQQSQLAELYCQLLRYTADCCHRAAGPGDCSSATGGQVALRSADALVPLLYDLTQKLGDVACEAWRAWLGDCWRRRQRRRRSYPGLGVLLPLRLCGQLFPSSDRRHPVTMPAMLLLTQMLAECRVGSRRELSAGLLAASLLMEFTSLSGRLVLEVVTFLHAVLYSALPAGRRPSLSPPPATLVQTGLLQLSASCTEAACDAQLPLSAVQCEAPLEDAARLTCLRVAVSLSRQLTERHAALPAGRELLLPLTETLAAADVRHLPDTLRNEWTACLACLQNISKEKTTMEKNKKRPKPLRLYEPAIEENFDGSRKRSGSAARRDHDRLVHKYKRQMRSTVREVRRDNAFVARAKLSELKTKDDDRKRKLKNLMSALQTQEGDFKRMKRQK